MTNPGKTRQQHITDALRDMGIRACHGAADYIDELASSLCEATRERDQARERANVANKVAHENAITAINVAYERDKYRHSAENLKRQAADAYHKLSTDDRFGALLVLAAMDAPKKSENETPQSGERQ